MCIKNYCSDYKSSQSDVVQEPRKGSFIYKERLKAVRAVCSDEASALGWGDGGKLLGKKEHKVKK